MKTIYLDTSSLIKRYLRENGTEVVDELFALAERGEVKLVFSIWGIGESLGVLDKKQVRKIISEEGFSEARRRLMQETKKLVRLGALEVKPVLGKTLTKTYGLLLKHHMYVADALHLASAIERRVDEFYSCDTELLEAASMEGLHAVNPEKAFEKQPMF